MAGKRRGVILLSETGVQLAETALSDARHRNATRALFAIRALAQRINDDANEWLAPLGLTSVKFNYLTTIYAADNHALPLSEIGSHIHTSTATITTMVDALERDGFVERQRNPDDRRSTLAKLTAKGKRTLERALPIHHRNIEAGMSELSSSERSTLIELLLKVNVGFDRHFDRFRVRTNGTRRKHEDASAEYEGVRSLNDSKAGL